MRSFRTEIEDPIVEKDILELEKKIRLFREGKVDEERFRSLRLARGIYGQRQPGVQMIRIKLPYGKMTTRQLRRIAAVSDEYSTGNLHITTRQDIQIHYVSLDRTPELWAELERDQVTLREACGNTVRNITASPTAGIDAKEAFDVTPYADTFFRYFLRNPICQEMGRKFKVSFSASEEDTAFAFMHDLGFIPKINKQGKRGFKVMIGGGLGAQPQHAKLAYEFLPVEEMLPFAEAVLRIFDRYGERAKRFKARFKFLLKDWGLEKTMELIHEEKAALEHARIPIETEGFLPKPPEVKVDLPLLNIDDDGTYEAWKATNAHRQKQAAYYSVALKVRLGDFSSDTARTLAELVDRFAADDIRLTVNQGIVLRFIPEAHLPYVYKGLKALGLADPGFDSTLDITACPGTDTCNLGISSSTGISHVLEEVMLKEYPHLIHDTTLKIKISGCMNACGQHSIAGIGFHGSTVKVGEAVAPALQVLLGGGFLGDGEAEFAQKVIKVPSKRGPDALRYVLDDYEHNREEGEYFHTYFRRQGKKYFYTLLKELANNKNLTPDEFIDWGHEAEFIPEIGVGECAGVVIDLVATLIYEAEEKGEWAQTALEEGRLADSIYHSYTAFVNGAKAILTSKEVATNTQAGIIKSFQELFISSGEISWGGDWAETVYLMKHQQPSQEFAEQYLRSAKDFLTAISNFYQGKQLSHVPTT
ncbi:MAG: nitrite reductase [Bacteroidota bacterium]